MGNIKFCTATTTVWLPGSGVSVDLTAGRAMPADDPVVIAFPHLFRDVPTVYDWTGTVVEQATAAPGERRAVRRAQ